jgi:YD repeat-containing protein
MKIKTIRAYRCDVAGGAENQAGQSMKRLTDQSEFDEAGHPVKEIKYDSAGSVEERSEYKYDEAGNMAEETLYGEGEEIAERKIYHRNPGGRIEKMIKHYLDGSIEATHYRYDDADDVVEKITTDEEEEEEIRELFEYLKGKLSRRTEYTNRQLTGEETFVYDEEGRISAHIKSIEGQEYTRLNHAYGPSGRITETLRYDRKGNPISRIEYVYNEAGQMTGLVEETSHGTQTTAIEYDGKGNAASQIETDQDGRVNHKVTRKYNDHNLVVETEVEVNYHGSGMNQHYLLIYEYEYHT